MTEREKLEAGILFSPADPELAAIKRRTHDLNRDFNALYEGETEKRTAILRQILGDMGEGTYFQGPITFHYGIHTHVGDRCFFNFNFTVQDDAQVTIGNDCNFGPNVTIVTPVHPMKADERRVMLNENGEPKHACYARPVTIGDDCWFGANVVVCPGVTIGDACVIGAGSVVTKDIPAWSVAAGNPCRVIRRITEADRDRFFREEAPDPEARAAMEEMWAASDDPVRYPTAPDAL